MESDFAVGDPVWYEVAGRYGSTFAVPATVMALTPKRIVVEFKHWSDGRLVRRAARPHRVSRREQQA